jgi:hypothetical protein
MWLSFSVCTAKQFLKRSAHHARNPLPKSKSGKDSYPLHCFMHQPPEVIERLSTSGQGFDQSSREEEIREALLEYCSLAGESGSVEPVLDEMMAELNELCSSRENH